MTTRRAFLSALAALPVIGRLVSAPPTLAAATDPDDAVIDVNEFMRRHPAARGILRPGPPPHFIQLQDIHGSEAVEKRLCRLCRS